MPVGLYTPEEYLILEEAADYKSEYIDGQIYAMAGGSTNHNRIAGNLYAARNFAFKTQEYDVFMSDVRLWIPKRRIYTYPDVMVISGEPDYYNNRTDTITNPQVIIEILSKSTQGYDCSDNFQAYRTIPSFQEYLLLDQTQRYVEHFSKIDAKQWSLREYDESDQAIAFSSIDFEISLTDAYNKVKFEPENAESE
ncbi:MAG: Uma2 family endonuclease [Coleofasciculus sp. B1-GNL1-01]|uniref:Uma2 family endonuclease n=1 Tax=Coleofasciculus sp. B1-GNL1-01 TaxID=3068484 RepID=UPI0032FA1BAB